MPNSVAYLMLLIWPVVCIALFLRLRIERAIVWSILGGYLLLPESTKFDLPLVPAMDKDSIPAITAFLVCVLLLRRKVPLWPRSVAARALTLLFLFGVIPTVLTNAEPIRFASGGLPGMSLHNLFSVIVNQFIVLLPFLLGRAFLSTETGVRELLLGLAVGGLVYSVPALAEVRLSPIFHEWIYGFFQHNFDQMIRDGGFRPIVFLPHALWLALFFLSALLATAALARGSHGAARVRYLAATLYLAAVLFFCKSLAAQLYGVVFAPLLLLGQTRMQIRVALVLALIAVIYPMLRNAGMIPLDAMLDRAEAIAPVRADSLRFRLDNEEQLLARAAIKPWFGWGQYGRNLVHDLRSGEILTIPDGRWIIVFGSYGWAGYIAEMGLLALPLFLLGARSRQGGAPDISGHVVAVSLILAANMIDMLLNATLVPHTWMLAGAILGYCEGTKVSERVEEDRGMRPVIGRPGKTAGRKTVL